MIESDPDVLRVGRKVVRVSAIAAAHWEKDKLIVHFIGGRFITLFGQAAHALWYQLEHSTVDLMTGGGGGGE